MTVPTHAELTVAMGGKPAFIDPSEIETLCKYAARSKHLLEIGCAWGGSTCLFLWAMPDDAYLSSIDPFVQDSMDSWKASDEECVRAVYTASKIFEFTDKTSHWALINDTSERVYSPHYSLDFLFIDGAHDETNVDQDFALWSTVLVSGGYLLLHDSRRLPGYPDDVFARGWQAPTALANRLRTDVGWRLVDTAFSLTVFEKVT